MATTIPYPKFQSYFHRGENELVNSFKCDKCGKEITEFNNCVCPYCGADIKKNMNCHCTTLLQQVFSGGKECMEEFEDDLLSAEDCVEQMAELQGILDTIVDYSEALKDGYEQEYKPYEAENEKLANNIFGRIVIGIVSLFNGGPGLGIGIGLALIFFLVVFQGILGVIAGLLGVVFIVVSIIALIRDRRSDEPYSYMLWFSCKNEIFHALKDSLMDSCIENLRGEQSSSITVIAGNITLDLMKELKEKADRAKKEEDAVTLEEVKGQSKCTMELSNWMTSMGILIELDYAKQKGLAEKDLDRKARQSTNDRRSRWNEFYENYGVFEI